MPSYLTTHDAPLIRECLRVFDAYVREGERLGRLLVLATRGISILRASPKLVEALRTARIGLGEQGEPPDDHERRLRDAETMARMAQEEVDSGFPLLHALVVVQEWTSLECAVRDLLVNLLAKVPSHYNEPGVARLKIAVGVALSLEPEERARVVLGLVEDNTAATFKLGVGRFEALLESFGYGGDVPDNLRRDILEFQQVRHVIVHRLRIVDARFKERCPWYPCAVGEVIRVTPGDLVRYAQAVDQYAVSVITRLQRVCQELESGEGSSGIRKPMPNPPLQPTGSAGG